MLLHFRDFLLYKLSCGGAKVIYCCRARVYNELLIGVSFYEYG
jgi:hypothetical protein